MHSDLVHEIQLIFVLLLIFIIGFGALAERLKIPYPILLVVAGLLLSFIPGLPRISLDPDFIFLAVLPPLLFASAVCFTNPGRRPAFAASLSLAGLVCVASSRLLRLWPSRSRSPMDDPFPIAKS